MWIRLVNLSVLLLVGFVGPVSADFGRGDFAYALRAHAFMGGMDVADSHANPGNQFAELPERSRFAELRASFDYRGDLLDLRLRPRLAFEQDLVRTEAEGRERRRDAEAFVNEGRLGLMFDNWDLWYGREILLWGPAMSLNPSNPFFIDSGRANPYRELGGRDFVTLSWLGPAGLSLSYHDNVRRGRGDLAPMQDFQRTRAIKLDRAGFYTYWGLNVAWREDDPDHVGAFFQATVADAWLAYTEIGLNRQRTQLRPSRDGQGPWHFAEPEDGDRGSGIGVLGMAYTFAAGPTINLEYLYNNQGWDDERAEDFQALVSGSAAAMSGGGQFAGLAAMNLAQAVQPGSVLLRRNYLFLQYQQPDLVGTLGLTLRIQHNLDDAGTRWIGMLDGSVGGHWRLFALGMVNTGDDDAEAKLYFEHQWLAGFNYTF